MGFFDNMKEKADKAAAENKIKLDSKVRQELEPLLLPGEEIESCYSLMIDFLAVTNKRLLFVDKKWTSSKNALVSVPWSKVSGVLMERGGFMKFSQEVEVIVGSKAYEFKFYSSDESMEAYKAILSKAT